MVELVEVSQRCRCCCLLNLHHIFGPGVVLYLEEVGCWLEHCELGNFPSRGGFLCSVEVEVSIGWEFEGRCVVGGCLEEIGREG